MSDCPEFVLSELRAEAYLLKEALSAYVHTILFNRSLERVEPEPRYAEVFEVSYVMLNNKQVQTEVWKNVEKFVDSLQGKTDSKKLRVTFYQTTVEKGTWLQTREVKVVWEKWVIPVTLVQSVGDAIERQRRINIAEHSVREELLRIAELAAQNADHVPDGTSKFEISTESDEPTSTFGIASLFRRIVS